MPKLYELIKVKNHTSPGVDRICEIDTRHTCRSYVSIEISQPHMVKVREEDDITKDYAITPPTGTLQNFGVICAVCYVAWLGDLHNVLNQLNQP